MLEPMSMRQLLRFGAILATCLTLAACSQTESIDPPPAPKTTRRATATSIPPAGTPTPMFATIIERYTVRNGDTLGAISSRYDVALEDLMQLNGITNAKSLQIGQTLKIPIVVSRGAPGDKMLPDSEVVHSPAYAAFDLAAFVNQSPGYLATFRDKVDGETLEGWQIVQLVAERYSVGPRVLLALIEFQSSWVSNVALTQTQIDYPMGVSAGVRAGLFQQLSWAAERLNEGYYGKITGRLGALKFKDRSYARIASNANPGTIAIQNVLAATTTWDHWQNAISASGFLATYKKLFGEPKAIEPLVPADIKQPTLRLPWSDGELWYFTGGPHAGWGDAASWSAVDFTPPDMFGACNASRYWSTAAAPGKVIRVEHGRVVVSLSNSDFQGVGWTLMYLHIASNGRVNAGAQVNAGDRIGHPSCEGGIAEATHTHFARLYNGQWMGVETMPMILSGWTITASEYEYDGGMTRGAENREACNCRDIPKNGIIADAGR